MSQVLTRQEPDEDVGVSAPTGAPLPRPSVTLRLPEADAEAARVFISYSRKDMAFVDRLEAALRERGIAPLVDRRDIEKSEDWWLRIEGLIEQAGAVVFVLSPDSVASEICEREVAFAAGLNKRIAPVVARPVTTSRVPDALGRLNYTFLDTEERWQAELDGLVRALTTDFAWVRQHAEYGKLARRWAAEGRPATLLLRTRALEDVQRWIALRPVNAEAPTEEIQALVIASRMGARRRRRMTTTSLLLGLIFAAALSAAAVWQRQIAVVNEQRANEQTALAEKQTQAANEQRRIAERQTTLATEREADAKRERDRAQKSLADAKTAADGLIFDLAQGLRGRGLNVATIQAILRRAETLMLQLVQSAPNDPKLRQSQAAMYSEFSDTYRDAGATDRQLESAERAVLIERQLVREDHLNVGAIRGLYVGMVKVGDAQRSRGDFVSAQNSYEESLSFRKRLLEADPSSIHAMRDLALGLERLGSVQLAQKDVIGAQKSYGESLLLRRRIAEVEPSENAARDVAVGLNKIGDIQVVRGDFQAAWQNYLEAVLITRRLSQSDPASSQKARDLGASLERLGDVQLQRNDVAGAEQSFEENVAISRRVAQADPSNAQATRELAISFGKLSRVYWRTGRASEACDLTRKGRAILLPYQTRSDVPKQFFDDLAAFERDLRSCPSTP